MLSTKLLEAAGNSTQPTYIEDVFSTYLYTGNGSTQTINNGIDLAGKGGLTWFAGRNTSSYEMLFDSARGVTKYLLSGLANAEGTSGAGERLTAYNNNGFSLGTDPGFAVNASGYNYVSWTFRKQPKFFDVVTYTGNGATQNIAHSLGSVPGCIIVKRTDVVGYSWAVYHNQFNGGSTPESYVAYLNSTAALSFDSTVWGNTAPTSSVFTVGGGLSGSGGTYVAYIFAHNAGGFGLTGTDNVISCGSFVSSGGTDTINLGFEPQWLLYKSSDNLSDWRIIDNMRGWSMAGNTAVLYPNLSNAEQNAAVFGNPTATGFQFNTGATISGGTYIYIAIRRGPMKVPTDGTKVFSPNAVNVPSGTQITSGFPVDMTMATYRSGGGPFVEDRLRGISTSPSDSTTEYYLRTTSTAVEANSVGFTYGWNNTGFLMNAGYANANDIFWNFRRAPGFFDEVCYTGTGVGTSQTHNLGVIPELKIIKCRSSAVTWLVGGSIVSGVGGRANALFLDSNAARTNLSTYWTAADTSTTFSVRSANLNSDSSGNTYVAYLFASCPGVSKVGSYTGTGSTQTINCGFTGGARFVLIKRTDSTGDWYVWDTARGIVSGNDPYLLMNSTVAEVTTTDYIDPVSSGFEISSAAPAAINASGGTYIYLAIA